MTESDAEALVVGLSMLLMLALAGPNWGQTRSLGDGSADVRVVAPAELTPEGADQELTFSPSPGRFGAAPRYLRTPDLRVNVTQLSGRPRIVYLFVVPRLGIEERTKKLIDGTGHIHLPAEDAAFPPSGYPYNTSRRPDPGTYEGRILVRVQSFTSDSIVVNRSIRVEVGA